MAWCSSVGDGIRRLKVEEKEITRVALVILGGSPLVSIPCVRLTTWR